MIKLLEESEGCLELVDVRGRFKGLKFSPGKVFPFIFLFGGGLYIFYCFNLGGYNYMKDALIFTFFTLFFSEV